MPLTPFHFGPGLFFGMIFSKYLNLLAFLIGNVIVDIEPFLVVAYEQFFGFSPYPYHGFLHTIIGAFLISLLVAFLLKCVKPGFTHFLGIFNSNSSFKRIFFSVFSGTLLHLVFDGFTHPDVWPFWPSHFNPLLGLINFSRNHINTIILGILGIVLLIFRIKRNK